MSAKLERQPITNNSSAPAEVLSRQEIDSVMGQLDAIFAQQTFQNSLKQRSVNTVVDFEPSAGESFLSRAAKNKFVLGGTLGFGGLGAAACANLASADGSASLSGCDVSGQQNVSFHMTTADIQRMQEWDAKFNAQSEPATQKVVVQKGESLTGATARTLGVSAEEAYKILEQNDVEDHNLVYTGDTYELAVDSVSDTAGEDVQTDEMTVIDTGVSNKGASPARGFPTPTNQDETPEPNDNPSQSPTPRPTVEVFLTPSSATPVRTTQPDSTPTVTKHTATATKTPGPTGTPEVFLTPSSVTPVRTTTPDSTPTITRHTPTVLPSETPIKTATKTATPSATSTPEVCETPTNTPTGTPEVFLTPSSATPVRSTTPDNTPTVTKHTPTVEASKTPKATKTPERKKKTPTASPTKSASPTPSGTPEKTPFVPPAALPPSGSGSNENLPKALTMGAFVAMVAGALIAKRGLEFSLFDRNKKKRNRRLAIVQALDLANEEEDSEESNQTDK